MLCRLPLQTFGKAVEQISRQAGWHLTDTRPWTRHSVSLYLSVLLCIMDLRTVPASSGGWGAQTMNAKPTARWPVPRSGVTLRGCSSSLSPPPFHARTSPTPSRLPTPGVIKLSSLPIDSPKRILGAMYLGVSTSHMNKAVI